jgi:hypothetical protein
MAQLDLYALRQDFSAYLGYPETVYPDLSEAQRGTALNWLATSADNMVYGKDYMRQVYTYAYKDGPIPELRGMIPADVRVVLHSIVHDVVWANLPQTQTTTED